MAYRQVDNTLIELTEEEEAQIEADRQASINEMLPIWNRQQRDQLLAESDWTQFNDSPLTGELKTSWATYRQTLRDLPASEGWPNVTFPDTP